jgi:drug/metabolite transporter (DMT)-like permease
VDVLDILAIRFLISFVVLYLLKVSKIIKINVGLRDVLGKTERSAYAKDLLRAAIFEPVLYMLFETVGISMATGVTVGVILSLAPISSCVCESVILKEKTTLAQKIFLGIGIVGVVYIALNTNTSDGKDTVAGIIFVLLAVVSGSLYSVFSRKSAAHFSTMEITYFSAMLGMTAFNAANVIRHLWSGTITGYFAPLANPQNVTGFLFLAVISTIVATGMNNFALSRLQVSVISAFGGLSTLVTIAVGVLWGGEMLYPFHYIGILLIVTRMIGVSYISVKRDRERSLNIKG